MSYARVEDGKIVQRTNSLPKSWDNISNFDVLEQEQIIEHGWYPHRFVETQKPDGYISDGSTYSIEQSEVVEYEKIREKTKEERDSEIESKWIEIRAQRNILLTESDWTQLSDSPLDNQKQIEWQLYRQQLRDITLADSPYGIGWPSKPES
jgi:hypothetical protein